MLLKQKREDILNLLCRILRIPMVWGRYRWCNAHGYEHYRIQILAQEVNMLVAPSKPNISEKLWEQEAQ